MEIETDVVSNSSGSARLRLANTDILVGIKAELGEPLCDRPNEGRLEFFVDCSANATPKFEGRGGEELASEISTFLTRAYAHPHCLDLKLLCVIPRQQSWVLYIDVLLLECGGNLHDAVSIAVKAALFNTRLPNLTVTMGEKGEAELELSDDPFDCRRLDVTNVPCVVTLNKIGHYHVVDATMQEEACTLGRILMGVTEKGTISAMKKDGCGSLHPDSIYDMMQSGKKVGETLNRHLMEQLREEEKMGRKKPQMGFLR
ncbi:hypothetical protein NP493_36g01044 [Ridgeia piscesae]|uniref:Ribosomal RNA-processing protein 42 n=1 Tax=Ridgeia piscesae TaxID=27915 RepID=A0AAD9PCT7_RIDPI|nr:hypothetical protein NP493_36g01044 [Ridgeia piscesae]